MDREIGSIYEIDRTQLGFADNLERNKLTQMYSKHGFDNVCLTASGREAIVLAIKNISAKAKMDTVGMSCVLPIYTCDTVIAPFEYYGFDIDYYPVNADLQPDTDKFKELLECNPDVVLIHAYYGSDTVSNVRPLLAQYREQGGIVIEDMTQCLFMEPDFNADYYAASLRKWFHMTDGGILLSRDAIKYASASERADFVKAKWIALTDKADYLAMVNDGNYNELQSVKAEFLKLNRSAEAMLDDDINVYAMSSKAKYIVNITDIEAITASRAENAQYLSRNLENSGGIKCPLTYGTDKEEAPLYFPIYSDRRDYIQEELRKKDIYAPLIWEVPEQLNNIMDRETEYIYNHILALPCDDRYTVQDMERICTALMRIL